MDSEHLMRFRVKGGGLSVLLWTYRISAVGKKVLVVNCAFEQGVALGDQ